MCIQKTSLMICNANRVVFFSHELRIQKKCERTHFQLKTLEYVCGFFSPFKTPSWKNSFTPSLFSLIPLPPFKHHPYVCFSRFELLITELIDFFTWPLISPYFQPFFILEDFFVVDVGSFFFFTASPLFQSEAPSSSLPPPPPFFFQKSF